MALVEAASRRLDFEQSRDGSATGARQPDNVPIDFPTKSGNLNVKQQSCSPYESKRNAGESHTNALNAVALHPDDRASLIIRGGVKDIDSVWADEAMHRARACDDGRMKTLAFEEVFGSECTNVE
ncbi:MAG: hypothetical protein WCL29_09170 [Pseudomonadota bacterium]